MSFKSAGVLTRSLTRFPGSPVRIAGYDRTEIFEEAVRQEENEKSEEKQG